MHDRITMSWTGRGSDSEVQDWKEDVWCPQFPHVEVVRRRKENTEVSGDSREWQWLNHGEDAWNASREAFSICLCTLVSSMRTSGKWREPALTVDQLTDGLVSVLLSPQRERGHVPQQTRANLVAVDGASPKPHIAERVTERDAETVGGNVLEMRERRRTNGRRDVTKELVTHQETTQRSDRIKTLQRGREVARVSRVDDAFSR